MNHSGNSLDEFFERYRGARKPLVLGIITHTIGSTYRKAGAQMLIAADGSVCGLLSGGCLEGDLAAHAQEVFATGRAKLVNYDTRTSEDLVWGIGLGCEGAMEILLTRLDAANGYEPFAHALRTRESHSSGSFALVVESHDACLTPGTAFTAATPRLPDQVQKLLVEQSHAKRPHQSSNAVTVVADNARFLVVPIELPIRLLLLGGGPDAIPLTEIAGLMGWHLTVADHRPAYAVAERFPSARHVICQPAAALGSLLSQQQFDAAVVMSHHLLSDTAYLKALAHSTVPYIGLLGPAARRSRLLNDIGEHAARLKSSRLYGPIGLDIGANTPETIALAIVSEIQCVAAGRAGGSFSVSVRS